MGKIVSVMRGAYPTAGKNYLIVVREDEEDAELAEEGTPTYCEAVNILMARDPIIAKVFTSSPTQEEDPI